MAERFDWFVGIDWATVDHQVCVVDAAGGEVRQRPVAHTAVAVRAFVDWLRQHVDDLTTVAVGIETPRGALVATLMEQGLAVFAVNPKQLDRFRDRHTVAGAKDDRRDARVLADSLRTDAGAFHRVEMDDARLVQLREFVHVEAALATDVSRLTNRLRDQVHRVQPALLALCAAADAPWFWTLWEQAPTVAAQRRLSSEAIGAILAARRIRRVTAAEVHAAVQAPALTTAPGVLEATEAHIAVLLLPQLRLIVAQRTACRHRTEALLAELATEEAVDGERNEHRDVQILRSLPGVGRQVAATMLAEASRPLRARDYHTLRLYVGVAPVTKWSGKRKRRPQVRMRRACNQRLRQAAYHWGRVSLINDEASCAYYDELRARGHTHGRALRSVIDRWFRILIAMLRNGTLYEPGRVSRRGVVGAPG